MLKKIVASDNQILQIPFFQGHEEKISYSKEEDKQKTLEAIADRLSVLYAKLFTKESQENKNYRSRFINYEKIFPKPEEVELFQKTFKDVFIETFNENEKKKRSYKSELNIPIEIYFLINHRDFKNDDIIERVFQKINPEDTSSDEFIEPLRYLPEDGNSLIEWDESQKTFKISLRAGDRLF